MRTVVIGVGRMGRRHVEAIRTLGLELVGVCDVNSEMLRLVERENEVASSLHFGEARTMLELTRAECVVVATTAPTHGLFVCLAAEIGAKAILCEKPMATSLAECNLMIETCRRHGARLAINHQMRFMKHYTEPKEIVSSPEFGGLCSVTVVAGNMGLAMNGVHYFEMLRYICESNPFEVNGWISPERVPNPRGPEFSDAGGCVRIVTVSGVRFYLDASVDQGHGFQVIYAGRFGQLLVDEATGDVRLSQRKKNQRDLPTTRYLAPFDITNQRLDGIDIIGSTCAVLESLVMGNHYPTGEDGRLAVRTLVSAHISSEQGHRPVRMDDPAIDEGRCFNWA